MGGRVWPCDPQHELFARNTVTGVLVRWKSLDLNRDGVRCRDNQARGRTQQPHRSEESSIQFWEVASGTEIKRIRIANTRIKQSVVAAHGKTLATATTDKTIRLWDVATGRELRRFDGGGEPGHIAFSPDGLILASTERVDPPNFWEDTPLTTPIHVWDTATGRELGLWTTENDSCVCFSPDRTTLATVGNQVIRLWEVASGREIRAQIGHRSAIGAAAFTPDGRSIVTAGHDRTIRFWDAATGKENRQLEGSDGSIGFAALSSDGKTLLTGYGFQPSRIWDVASGRELRRFQLPGKADDQFVACTDLLRMARRWPPR